MAPKNKSKSKYSRPEDVESTQPVFEIDTTGSASIRHSILHGQFAARARRGVKKTLRADEILNEHKINGPEPLQARVRSTSSSKTSKILTKTEKKQLEKIVLRKKDEGGIDPEKRNGTTSAIKPPPRPEGDIWTSGSKPSTEAQSALPSVKPPPGIRHNGVIEQAVQQLPAAPGLKAVPIPHPGQSYNPTVSDHQTILRSNLEKLEEEEREAERLRQINERVTAGLGSIKAKTQWELCEEDVGEGEDVREQQRTDSHEVLQKKKTTKKKTTAQRNRKARAMEEARMLLKKRHLKQMRRSIEELPKIMDGLSEHMEETEQAKIERKAKRVKLIGEYGVKASRGGEPKKMIKEFQLTEDLSGLSGKGLRGLKPEGNLWRDWNESSSRRGKIEQSRIKNGLIKGPRTLKGRSFKDVEKHAWKNFECR